MQDDWIINSDLSLTGLQEIQYFKSPYQRTRNQEIPQISNDGLDKEKLKSLVHDFYGTIKNKIKEAIEKNKDYDQTIYITNSILQHITPNNFLMKSSIIENEIYEDDKYENDYVFVNEYFFSNLHEIKDNFQDYLIDIKLGYEIEITITNKNYEIPKATDLIDKYTKSKNVFEIELSSIVDEMINYCDEMIKYSIRRMEKLGRTKMNIVMYTNSKEYDWLKSSSFIRQKLMLCTSHNLKHLNFIEPKKQNKIAKKIFEKVTEKIPIIFQKYIDLEYNVTIKKISKNYDNMYESTVIEISIKKPKKEEQKLLESENEFDRCPICKIYKKNIALNCGHLFCAECSKNTNCGMCNKVVSQRLQIYL